VAKYLEWANNYQENQVSIVYDTMWNGTRRMAEAIGEGLVQADPTLRVRLFNAGKADKNDIVTEIFRSKAVLVGSPTINKGYLSSLGGLLEMVRGLGFKNKKAAAFGAYGWSGESVKLLTAQLKECGFEVPAASDAGIRAMWNPDADALEQCRVFGLEFGKSL